ncbi:hypothetical protein [Pedobacter duraquae]|uniref:Uncharacterized protein n=1 Tax=Pedobacter duraquae TaxID=425511 RepID=A0A4V3C3B4_9SPHI|nr:hypothetical protein [Pedobacter duraquae]TDO21439.1 hypothetical protein CLV32_2544 [Pedobacter duraquae]
MKNYLISFCLIMSSIIAFAQQKIIVDTNVVVTLPNNYLIYEDLAFREKTIKEYHFVIESMFRNSFKVDNTVIRLFNKSGERKDDILASTKRLFDYKSPPSDYDPDRTTEYLLFNGNKFLLVHYRNRNSGHFKLSCYNSDPPNLFFGDVDYVLGEKEKAKSLIIEIMKSLVFIR